MNTFLGLIIGIAAIVKAFSMKRALDKYEFENRTDGGVIKFPDYEAKKKHDRNHGIAKLLFMVGLILICMSIFLYFA